MSKKTPDDVVRPEDAFPWPKAGLLVGVDGSVASVAALREASVLAEKLELPVHAVAFWDYPDLVYGDYNYPEAFDSPKDDAARVLRTATMEVFGDAAPGWFSASTRRGRPARELVRLSREAAMLVVGSRGRGGFVGLLLGSVSAACAAHAQCPVLVVRQPLTQ